MVGNQHMAAGTYDVTTDQNMVLYELARTAATNNGSMNARSGNMTLHQLRKGALVRIPINVRQFR